MSRRHVWLAALALAVALGACDSLTETGAQPHELELASAAAPVDVILSHPRALDARLASVAAARGDRIKHLYPEAGFAVVTTTDPSAYGRFASTVIRDARLQWVAPDVIPALEGAMTGALGDGPIGNPPDSGSSDFFFNLQWGHAAVGAPAAWNAGVRGQGVRIAILDSGFDLTHPELEANIDFEASRSMLPGVPLDYQLGDGGSHGTMVAGIVAAAQNGFGTIGVAPDAQLVLIRVLGDEGSGSFGDILAGFAYAADAGVDVLNASLGTMWQRSGFTDFTGRWVSAREVAALLSAATRVTNYAHQRGVTMVASAGNAAMDSNRWADAFHPFSQLPHVLAISATGPYGWALDQGTDLDVPGFYTNYGLSHIQFAAPGGNIDFGLMDSGAICEAPGVPGLYVPCWVFDLVVTTTDRALGTGAPYGYNYFGFTSAAAPYAAGVAALIISEHGAAMHPAQVAAELRARATDLGKPGRDPYYGFGRVHSGY
jgi:subtilisin family serine protease